MLMGQKLVRDVRSVVDVRIHAEGCRVHHDLERLHGVLVEVGVAVMESGFLTGHEKVLDRQLAKNIADRLCGTTGSQDQGATMVRAKDRSDGEFKAPGVCIESVQFELAVLETLDPDRVDRTDPLGNIIQVIQHRDDILFVRDCHVQTNQVRVVSNDLLQIVNVIRVKIFINAISPSFTLKFFSKELF